ncbi:alpha amylase catalytic region [Fibrella aestuarina BUZ 2]|uniref:Alpha-amylase n=1 Tax=Fibrella aestuarina BUZ 2 TaxID=1166018 RepID=I0KBM3_9BACT|nr:alpha-amylase family glycosyl hydrolase [Fibrella aestuarina]CCH01526.1 alpha amylase catalytic region [Fibrella aestuarina BUZ 2]
MRRFLHCFLFLISTHRLLAQNQPVGEPPRVGYQIFVRSFADSNGDGIGDINGITAKLDYLQQIGADVLWLTPVSPSPSYHKYDVTDYRGIDPEFGTMADFKRLLTEAHRRKMKVLFDFVINHSSSQHPWFKAAVADRQSPYRNWYVWMSQRAIDSMGVAYRERTADSWELRPWHTPRGESASPDAEKYYGLFWGGMPDLNMDNQSLRRELYDIGRFWLTEVGVDGFRLDAAKHIYPQWDVAKNHQFWQEFRQALQTVKPDVLLLGEVWDTADKVAPYFKGLPANFHFDACFALQNMAKTGRDSSLVSKLLADYAAYGKENPAFVSATMVNNHDQNRIGSIVGGDPNRMRVAASLLLTLPGQPWIYYGEELGMLGTKPDELIREPFLWTTRATDTARTRWQTPRFSTDSTVAPLSQQQTDPKSLYNHYRKLIALRRQTPALAQVLNPNLQPSSIRQDGVLAFVRPHASGDVLVVHNLGNVPSTVTLPTAERRFRNMLFTSEATATLQKDQLTLPPYSVVVLRK